MKVLLHICCAPCLIYPLERLREEGFEVKGFFYNPNVHPFSEYKNRREAVENFSRSVDIEFAYPEYLPAEFFQAANLKEVNPGRCLACWTLRLKKTAKAAKEMGCDYFTTTLLVSPYQDQELLKRIGSNISKEEGIAFHDEDFRPGFRQAHTLAKKQGIYCQRYCGCIYSEIERCRQSEKH